MSDGLSDAGVMSSRRVLGSTQERMSCPRKRNFAVSARVNLKCTATNAARRVLSGIDSARDPAIRCSGLCESMLSSGLLDVGVDEDRERSGHFGAEGLAMLYGVRNQADVMCPGSAGEGKVCELHVEYVNALGVRAAQRTGSSSSEDAT